MPPRARPPSVRVRAQENPLFTTALAKAVHLKAMRLGNAPGAPSMTASPLSSLELRALGEGCDLDREALAELADACASVIVRAP